MIQTTAVQDNVEVAVYEIAALRERIPGWDDLEKPEQLEALRSVDPVHEFTSHNVTTSAYREHLSRLINPNIAEDPIDVSHIAFGDDDTAASLSDEHLKNEVYRDEIDDHIDRDHEYAGVLLIGSDEAVGLEMVEAALVSEDDPEHEDDTAANRVILDDPDERLQPKDADHAVTVRIELSYLDESEVSG